MGCGTYTSALGFSGEQAGDQALTESWNGTNWANENAMNTARNNGGGAGSGTTTAGLAFGGGPPMQADTELWFGDGTLSENID